MWHKYVIFWEHIFLIKYKKPACLIEICKLIFRWNMKIFMYHIWKSWPRYYCKNMEIFLIFHIWKFPYEIWNSLHFTFEIWPHIITWNITYSLYHNHKSLLKFSYMKDWNLCTSHMKIHLHMKSGILTPESVQQYYYIKYLIL